MIGSIIVFPFKVSAELERLHASGCALGPALLVTSSHLLFGKTLVCLIYSIDEEDEIASKSKRQEDKKVLVESQVSLLPVTLSE